VHDPRFLKISGHASPHYVETELTLPSDFGEVWGGLLAELAAGRRIVTIARAVLGGELSAFGLAI
jgi:hypothetical protein